MGLLGKNGAGKSTIQKLICGLANKTSGSIVGAEGRIGVCRQNDCLWDGLTCTDHLELFGGIVGGGQKDIEEVLLGGGLWEKRRVKAGLLSGGMKRRLSASIALLVGRVEARRGAGGLCLFDEPSSGLDRSNSKLLWRAIRGLREGKVGVLIATHSGEEAEVLCENIFMLGGAHTLREQGDGGEGGALVEVVCESGYEEKKKEGVRELVGLAGGRWDGRRLAVEVEAGKAGAIVEGLRELGKGDLVWSVKKLHAHV